MNWLPLFVIIGVVVLIFYFQKCSLTCKSDRDDYGQDASIRATTGWIAGPMYGYDPIDQFAEEIEVFKQREHAHIREDAQAQTSSPTPALRILDQQPGEIVDQDGKSQDEKVLRDEVHIEHATSRQQHGPALAVW